MVCLVQGIWGMEQGVPGPTWGVWGYELGVFPGAVGSIWGMEGRSLVQLGHLRDGASLYRSPSGVCSHSPTHQQDGTHKASQGSCLHCEPRGFLRALWPPLASQLVLGLVRGTSLPRLPHSIGSLQGAMSVQCQGGRCSCRNAPAQLSIPHLNRSMMHCRVSRGMLLNLLISCNCTHVKKHLFPLQSHRDTRQVFG